MAVRVEIIILLSFILCHFKTKAIGIKLTVLLQLCNIDETKGLRPRKIMYVVANDFLFVGLLVI